MSDGQKVAWITLVFLTAVSFGIVGHYGGVKQGRAEQKAWSDAWYAKHPVYPTLSGPAVCLERAVACTMFEGRAWAELPLLDEPITPPAKAPAPKPAPRKGALPILPFYDKDHWRCPRGMVIWPGWTKYYGDFKDIANNPCIPAPRKAEKPAMIGEVCPEPPTVAPCPAGGFVITIPRDESADKAACEKDGGRWHHMDGSQTILTNPPITTSHCDPSDKPAGPEKPASER